MMLRNRIISLTLVIVQFTCLFLLVYTGSFFAEDQVLLGFEIIGLILVTYSIWLMIQFSKLSAEPMVQEGAKLIFKGPYKFIRHPMYLSLIIISVSLLLDYFTTARLIIVSVLICDLIFKILFEEKQLLKTFTDYRHYMQTSWRILPYIF